MHTNLIHLAIPVQCDISLKGKHHVFISCTEDLVVKHLSCTCSRKHRLNAALMVQALGEDSVTCAGIVRDFRQRLNAESSNFDPYIYGKAGGGYSLYYFSESRKFCQELLKRANIRSKVDNIDPMWRINKYGDKESFDRVHYKSLNKSGKCWDDDFAHLRCYIQPIGGKRIYSAKFGDKYLQIVRWRARRDQLASSYNSRKR